MSIIRISIFLLFTFIFLTCLSFSQEDDLSIVKHHNGSLLNLTKAFMCENIKDYNPYNIAVVFSVSIGKVFCFSSFNQVSEPTFVYHNWYRNDRMTTKIKLSLQPSKSAVFSSIQLRESDKGPWRVEIYDDKNNIINVLRFSITD